MLPERTSPRDEDSPQAVLRGLSSIWLDFESQVHHIPIVRRVIERRIRLADYHELLLNHRAQVMNGALWIARAASNIGHEFAELRSRFIRHAAAEHRDYLMLEEDYLKSGGDPAGLARHELNIGSEALSAWIFHRADQPNPFDLLGAMYIIEGLGKRVAAQWAEHVRSALRLEAQAVSFYLYHAKADEDHLGELEEALRCGILNLPRMAPKILKAARVTARLYRLQLEEIGSY
ncbi:iron-containing redox enzyme family protein [Sorangium sp. So ce124]|uniref:iron-containing redox enzyme family protein n=1 Tax=Sorangium sp. So ce124 TaxID=3133280 RepID=UPI003F63241E